MINATEKIPMLNVPFIMKLDGEDYLAVRRALDGRYELRNIGKLCFDGDDSVILMPEDFTGYTWNRI